MTCAASVSMSSCRTIRTDSRIRSTPSPARNASRSSDTADWDSAIGGLLFSVCFAVHTEDPADGPPASSGHAVDHPKPHHPRGLTHLSLQNGDRYHHVRAIWGTDMHGNSKDQSL